jgi:hypothetical protein
LVYDDRTGTDFVLFEKNIMQLQYTATDLISGDTYKFKLQARNSFGLSAYSEEIELTVGYLPAKPDAPTSEVVQNLVKFTWTEPLSNGAPITAYKLLIRQQDELTFTEALDDCNASEIAIVQALECTVPLDVLMTAPWNLVFGDAIYAKVSGINYYGEG